MPLRGGIGGTAAPAARSRLAPTGAFAESFPRHSTPAGAAIATTSGTLWLQPLDLRVGDTVTNLTFVSDSTAGSGMTHQWFVLYDSARARLAQSADDTNTAWAANSAKTLAMGTPYPVTTDGLYYAGICVVGSTVPTFENARLVNNLVSVVTPKLCGPSDSGLNTATAPNPAAALGTSSGITFYCYAS